MTQFLGGGWGFAAGHGSSLARLHVGRDGAASRQALEALVGVVDEDPVLVLQLRLAVVGHWRCGGAKRALVPTQTVAERGDGEGDWGLPEGVRMSESGNSSKLDVSSMLLISMGMAAGRSLVVGVGTWEKHTTMG